MRHSKLDRSAAHAIPSVDVALPMGLAEAAKRFIDMRNQCAPLLPKTMLRDLSWDLMLELFLAAEHRQTPFIKQLSSIADEPFANVQRRIDHLEGLGLIRRQQDEDDHRRVRLSLTKKGYAAIANMLRSLYDFHFDGEEPLRPVSFKPLALSNIETSARLRSVSQPEPRIVRADSLSAGPATREALAARFKTAIEQGHIWPAFQPMVEIQSGKIVGFEILARWTDPIEGKVSPSEFIPSLEKFDLIDELSDFLMREACTSAKQWSEGIFLAFNISPVQFAKKELCDRISACASRCGFPLSRIELEITDSCPIAEVDRVQSTLEKLNALGLKIAIDDFGKGYSNLAALTTLPFCKMKIDAGFVRALDSDAARRRIAAAVIGLGQNLGVTVVAEGVETKAEEAVLRDFNCDLGQGWLYGKPVSASEAKRLLAVSGAGALPTPSLD